MKEHTIHQQICCLKNWSMITSFPSNIGTAVISLWGEVSAVFQNCCCTEACTLIENKKVAQHWGPLHNPCGTDFTRSVNSTYTNMSTPLSNISNSKLGSRLVIRSVSHSSQNLLLPCISSRFFLRKSAQIGRIALSNKLSKVFNQTFASSPGSHTPPFLLVN